MNDFENRRAIAEALRECAKDGRYFTAQEIEGCLDSGSSDEELFRRLADLIEPKCDRNALLELADRVQLIHSDPLKRGREACDYYGIGGDLDCEDCEAYTSDSKCLDLAIADVSRRIRAIANGLDGGSDAPLEGDGERVGTDAHDGDNEAAEVYHRVDVSDKFNENVAAMDFVRENGGLEAVKARLMPEGMEWPRFDDGAPVRFEDEWCPRTGGTAKVGQVVLATDGGFALNASWYDKGERVKRPAPKVLDADGVEIRIGDTVYLLTGDWCDKFPCYGFHGGEELKVYSLNAEHVEGGIGCKDVKRFSCFPQPSQLTHNEPIADSWERLFDDALKSSCDYFGHSESSCNGCPAYDWNVGRGGDGCTKAKAREIVRRAKALSEKGM